MENFSLVADIGGTNARFGVVGKDLAVQNVGVFQCQEFEGPTEAISSYLDQNDLRNDTGSGCIAIAGPVRGDRVKLTNGPWEFSIAAVRRTFGWRRLRVVNDFAAQAAAVPYLAGRDVRVLLLGEEDTGATRVILGPGTGLGVAATVWNGQGWTVVAGEGGHISFAPQDRNQREVLKFLSERHGRVSNDHVLCGSGLEAIYAALTRRGGGMSENLPASVIVDHALVGKDDYAVVAVRIFLDTLAAVSGDMALAFGARGGVYIGGGMVSKMLDLVDLPRFRQRFSNKGTMSSFLSDIQVQLVINDAAGLVGAARLLR